MSYGSPVALTRPETGSCWGATTGGVKKSMHMPPDKAVSPGPV